MKGSAGESNFYVKAPPNLTNDEIKDINPNAVEIVI